MVFGKSPALEPSDWGIVTGYVKDHQFTTFE